MTNSDEFSTNRHLRADPRYLLWVSRSYKSYVYTLHILAGCCLSSASYLILSLLFFLGSYIHIIMHSCCTSLQISWWCQILLVRLPILAIALVPLANPFPYELPGSMDLNKVNRFIFFLPLPSRPSRVAERQTMLPSNRIDPVWSSFHQPLRLNTRRLNKWGTPWVVLLVSLLVNYIPRWFNHLYCWLFTIHSHEYKAKNQSSPSRVWNFYHWVNIAIKDR